MSSLLPPSSEYRLASDGSRFISAGAMVLVWRWWVYCAGVGAFKVRSPCHGFLLSTLISHSISCTWMVTHPSSQCPGLIKMHVAVSTHPDSKKDWWFAIFSYIKVFSAMSLPLLYGCFLDSIYTVYTRQQRGMLLLITSSPRHLEALTLPQFGRPVTSLVITHPACTIVNTKI